MTTLHTLNKAPASQAIFEQMLNTANAGDAVLLIEDGVYYCLQSTINRRIQDIQVYALQDDLHARGIPYEDSDVKLASYDKFVELCTNHDKVINWY